MLNGATCQSLGFAGGVLACGTGCFFDTSGCFHTRFVDNGDGTITDHQTGLMWEKKTGGVSAAKDAQGVGACLNCVGDTYTWPTAMSEWLSALNGRTDIPVAQTGYAGHSDWRLPTIVELQTILLVPCPSGVSPCVDPIFNNSTSFTALFPSIYWSSSTFASNLPPSNAWDVRFSLGGELDGAAKNNAFSVRAVRSGR
jgi:hypothetical protein